ncbi:polysaccharide lyase [Mycobacterium sp. AT1]|uniref:polysaccharide lyase n=1 Tax=Mycobacterium sp. AT1 TaxID=1961706 RepID=UPI001E5FE1FD|nr:polysaccharide lyase [Mycobacterium sp. AT1]
MHHYSSTPANLSLGRRRFVQLSMIGAAAALTGCTTEPSAPPEQAPFTKTQQVDDRRSLFVGDYSTGDFSQWWVQCKGYNGEGSEFKSDYSASIVDDPTYGKAARYEVRTGDVPPFGGGERSEVSGTDASGGAEGQIRWYQFATKFDESFPSNHSALGWGLTNQWHGDGSLGSPPLNWTVGEQDGQWTLVAERQSDPGGYLGQLHLFRTPINPGSWHEVKMEVLWSTSDTKGYVRLWLNGARQTFTDGSDTYFVRTLLPGSSPAPTVYYKEGYYRENDIPATGIVYHSGFVCAAAEEEL